MILITGATGTVGRELVKLMARPGKPVRVMVRDRRKAESIAYPGVEMVEGDFGNVGTLDDALSGIHKAFLLSATDEHQSELESNFVQAAARANLRHLVKLSALGASPNSPARLLRWHAETERQIEAAGIPFTHLRPNQFMQNFLAYRPTIQAQGAFYSPMGAGRISIVDVRDVAAVAAEVLEEHGHEGKIYDITGPEDLSYDELAEDLTNALGRPVQYADVPPDRARQSMVQTGMPEWLADALLELFAIWSNNGSAEVTPVVRNIGKRDPIRFADFARDYAPMLG